MNILEKHVKKPLFKQNFSLFEVNFGRLGLKFCTNHWAIFSRKKSPNAIKNRPNGEISPNLVTLSGIEALFTCINILFLVLINQY